MHFIFDPEFHRSWGLKVEQCRKSFGNVVQSSLVQIQFLIWIWVVSWKKSNWYIDCSQKMSLDGLGGSKLRNTVSTKLLFLDWFDRWTDHIRSVSTFFGRCKFISVNLGHFWLKLYSCWNENLKTKNRRSRGKHKIPLNLLFCCCFTFESWLWFC